jgi:dTDP-4-dehydrorhamnose reductase
VRALVIGASGLVGSALIRELGPDAVGTFRTRPRPGLRHLDARDADPLAGLLDEVRPDLVFFPAAEPNVDWCEEHPDDSRALNVVPALTALDAARATGAGFVFFSSDYVFDGRAGPYAEGDAPSPVQVYGRHKLAVEERVIAAGGTVVRTTTVFGEEPAPPKNFVLRFVQRLRERGRWTVPSDQVATPTWADELARGTAAVATLGGIWHVAGPELLARDVFARMIADVFDLDPSLIDAVPTSALGQRAARPLLGGLRTDKLSGRIGGPLLAPRPALDRLRRRLEVTARASG